MPQRSEWQSSRLRELYNTFPTPQQLFVAYNRDLQLQLIGNCSHSQLAEHEDIPTLAEVSNLYTEVNAINWLKIQLGTISDFAGASTKMSDMQLNLLAKLVLGKYYYLNLAEICYFVGRFNSACYEEFYGSVDPMKIMKALSHYDRERVEDIERSRAYKKANELNENLLEKNPTYIEYQEIKKMAESGDEVAKLILLPKEERERELTEQEIKDLYSKVHATLSNQKTDTL